MNRISIRPFLILLAASGMVFAQSQPPVDQSQQPGGGWRRVGDPPAATVGQDTEPVDRSDAYGQPQRPAEVAPPAAQPPAAQPAPHRPAYGLPAQVTVKPGTFVTVRTNEPLSSDHSQPGDMFTGTLMQPLIADGIVIAQRGQTVYGRVAEVKKQHSSAPSRLGLELTGLTLADGTQANLHSKLVSRQGGTSPTGQQVGTVATTTAVGAVVGAAADRGTGAAVGAGAGAAAGLVGVLLTRNHATVVYPETPLTFQVTAPLTVSTANAPQAFRYVGPEDYDRPVTTQVVRRPAPTLYTYPGYYYPGYYPYYPYYPYWGWGGGIGIGIGFGGYGHYGFGGYHRFR